MNKEIKEKWISALRSGKYEQGIKTLLDIDTDGSEEVKRYCCLGVLCEIYAETHPKCIFDSLGEFNDDAGDFSSSILPMGVKLWAELEFENPPIKGEYMREYDEDWDIEQKTSLAELNDHGVGFEHIADIIEKEL